MDPREHVRAALPTMGAKLWGDSPTRPSYDQFQRIAQRIGEAPGIHLP